MRTDIMNDSEDRLELLRSYYSLDVPLTLSIIALPHAQQRKLLCKEHGVDASIVRTMIDYNRYFEASNLEIQLLRLEETLTGLRLLDFGCLVSDYGLYFARRGATVSIYDDVKVVEFARFRFVHEKLSVQVFTIPTHFMDLFLDCDLVIFGEVLEHMHDPLSVLAACVVSEIKYIFTSCYPFGDDQYFSLPGHSKSAQKQQTACINLMDEHFTREVTHKKANFWVRRVDPKPKN